MGEVKPKSIGPIVYARTVGVKDTVLAILGPTASGKTQLALDLAKTHPIEIISLDSALVYRDMDIGTAKPSIEELNAVPHHLINIISPLETYSAANFVTDTQLLVKQIRARNKTPVIVGGTMMYFKALTEGLNDLPSGDKDIREKLQQQKELNGLESLYQELQKIDPETANRLKPNDAQRIERALEVYLLTGKTMSAHFSQSQKAASQLNLYTLALIPEIRQNLHDKIAERFHIMMSLGFVSEVETLIKNYPELTEDHPSIRCVGYRQMWQYLHGQVEQKQMIELGIIATRQLAKRQLTWLRQTNIQKIIDPYQDKHSDLALTSLQRYLDKNDRT